MRIVITGGAGFLGTRLARKLLERGTLVDAGGRQQTISSLVLLDVVPPATAWNDKRVSAVTGDLADPAVIERAVTSDTASIFHLAAVVSGQAEADFDIGMRVNLDATRLLLERCRRLAAPPKFVFASSLAVFGGPLPDPVPDDAPLTPQASYGTQKAIGELLVYDMTRKGFIDGRSLRLPTVTVRPGKPNKAASGFFSNIIREPLAGEEAVLPVSEDVRHWHASPKSAVGFLLHAGTMDLNAIGPRRNLSMPGMSVTVGEQIAALDRVAGKNVTARIKRVPDPTIIGIVSGWPRDFVTDRALKLGFTTAEKTFDDIIRIHIEAELGGKFAG